MSVLLIIYTCISLTVDSKHAISYTHGEIQVSFSFNLKYMPINFYYCTFIVLVRHDTICNDRSSAYH